MRGTYDFAAIDSNFALLQDSQIPNRIEIFPPSCVKTKGSGKRLKNGKEKLMKIQQQATRLCRNCGEQALHDNHNYPKKSMI